MLLVAIVAFSKESTKVSKDKENIHKHNLIIEANMNEIGIKAPEIPMPQIQSESQIKQTKAPIQLTISMAGDVTIGSDLDYGMTRSFVEEVNKQKNLNYFVENIKDIFSADDLTIVNLETPLTKATKKAEKKFRFKGDPSYVEILQLGSIEAVNIANNHTYDYLEIGYKETIDTLDHAGIGYFGGDFSLIREIKGVKVGLLGYLGWENSAKIKEKIRKDITTIKKEVDIVLVSFHWGIEREYYPNKVQTDLGRYAIDSGADLVFGHHPHVLQGIESYKGKYIVYSLGNFMFGGNRNPDDKDTIIFQQIFTFNLDNRKITDSFINVIPASISSVKWRNDYKPSPVSGKEGERILAKLLKISSDFNKPYNKN